MRAMQKDYSSRFLAMLPFVAYAWETLTVSDTYGALWMRGDEVFRRTNSDSSAQSSTCICCLIVPSKWNRVKLSPTLKPNLKRSMAISAKNKSLITGSGKCVLWQAGRLAGRAADPHRPHHSPYGQSGSAILPARGGGIKCQIIFIIALQYHLSTRLLRHVMLNFLKPSHFALPYAPPSSPTSFFECPSMGLLASTVAVL